MGTRIGAARSAFVPDRHVQARVGSFDYTSGSVVYPGARLDFTPKAIIFFSTGQAATGDGVDAGMTIGVASELRRTATNNNDRSVGFYDQDNVGTSACRGMRHNTSSISLQDQAGTNLLAGSSRRWTRALGILSSTGTDGLDIHFLAIGGDGVRAIASHVAANTSTGAQSATGATFRPTAGLLLQAGQTVGSGSAASAQIGVGAADENLARWAAALSTQNGQAAANVAGGWEEDKVVGLAAQGGGSYTMQADITSFDADGFSINWDAVSGSAWMLAYLLVGGRIRTKVGAFAQPAATGFQSITGLGFRPQAIIFSSIGATADGLVTGASRLSFGATDGVNQRAIWAGATDAADPTVAKRSSSATACILLKTASAVAPTEDATASIVGMNGDGFTLNWTAADATARRIGYLALG